MNTWAPVWNGLVDSSIWEEPDPVFRVFVAMMSLKDEDHVVRLDDYRLARRIHMKLPEVLEALKVLEAPDTKRPDQEFQGKRIKKVEDGWLVLNGEKYRKMIQDEMRKARNRRAQRAFRERQKLKHGQPLAGEAAYVKAEARGDVAECDRLAAPAAGGNGGETEEQRLARLRAIDFPEEVG